MSSIGIDNITMSAQSNTSRGAFLYLCFMLYILSPKIELIPIGSAAIRPEDIFFLLAALTALAGGSWRAINPPRFLNIYMVYLLVQLISAAINLATVGPISFLFVFRQLQYVVWVAIAAEFAKGVTHSFFKKGINYISVILIIWAIGELTGVIPKTGRFVGADNRLSLNTSGPYEVSVLAVMFMLLSSYLPLRVGLFGILLATQARVTLASAIVIWIFRHSAKNMFSKWTLLYLSLAVIAWSAYGALGGQIFNSSRVVSDTASAMDMWTTLSRAWNSSWVIEDLDDYFYVTYTDLGRYLDLYSDVSFEIRAVRWSFIIKAWLSDFHHFFLGWGPGAWDVAVDGNYVRVVGEAGLVGFVMFMRFIFSTLSDRDVWSEIKKSMVVIIITSVFIDIATASKVMSVFWMLTGLYASSRAPAASESANSERAWEIRTG
jgi:hypothetical protein